MQVKLRTLQNFVGGKPVDSDGATTRRYGVLTLPSTFFVDRDGVIRHLELRQMTEAMIRTGIQKAR